MHLHELVSSCLYLSTYIVVVIAVDRCSAVLDPLCTREFSRKYPGV